MALNRIPVSGILGGTANRILTDDGSKAQWSTSISASVIGSGTIATARLGSGTASSSTFLRGDQTWATVSASPGGSSTQVQYNNSGSFAGSAGFTFNSGTTALTLNGTLSCYRLNTSPSGTTDDGVTVTTPASYTGYSLKVVDSAGYTKLRLEKEGFLRVANVSGTAGTSGSFYGEGYANSGGFFGGVSYGGTVSSATQTTTDAFLVGLGGAGYTGSASTSNRGIIQIKASENYSGSAQGCYIAFQTTRSGTTTRAEKFRISDAGSIVCGEQAALSTSATDGFLYIPTCAGAPSGTPVSYTGKVGLVYDTTNNLLYLYNGAWKSVALA